MVITIMSRPGKAPPHVFDTFRRDPEACYNAFNGRNSPPFSHIWILRSPDLNAWWDPNVLRAEAELILDSDDQEVIKEVLSQNGSSVDTANHVRTLPKGRIYHVLLFNKPMRIYAHLRYSYRSEQADGSTMFFLVTDHNGASPVKDCPGFLEFERRYLAPQKEREQAASSNR
jgi:hypothetical protein